MLKEGITAKDINIASFEGDKAKIVANFINAWLTEHEWNEIYDITFQQGNNISAFVVYKQVEEPSNEAPGQITLT